MPPYCAMATTFWSPPTIFSLYSLPLRSPDRVIECDFISSRSRSCGIVHEQHLIPCGGDTGVTGVRRHNTILHSILRLFGGQSKHPRLRRGMAGFPPLLFPYSLLILTTFTHPHGGTTPILHSILSLSLYRGR